MPKLTPEVLKQYPYVRVFLAKQLAVGEHILSGIHKTRLIRSNGINMLCCDDEGQSYLIALRDTIKVSPHNDDSFICRYDPVTDCILVKSAGDSATRSLGPVRGRPDPNINLAHVAHELGLSLEKLPTSEVALPKPNLPSKQAITTAELDCGPVRRTYAELMNSEDTAEEDIMLVDELEVPDLSDFEVDDDTEALDTEVPDHKGRVSDE